MGIKAETQIVITCDECGDNYIEARTRKATIKLARQYGYSIGKYVLCFDCKGAAKG